MLDSVYVKQGGWCFCQLDALYAAVNARLGTGERLPAFRLGSHRIFHMVLLPLNDDMVFLAVLAKSKPFTYAISRLLLFS